MASRVNPGRRQTIPAVGPSVRLDPRAFSSPLAGAAEAFDTFAAGISDLAEKSRKAQAARELGAAQALLTTEVGEFELKLESDTDFLTQRTRFDAEADKIRDRLLAGISDDGARSAFSTAFDKFVANRSIEVGRKSIKGLTDSGRAELDANLEMFLTKAARAGTPEEREQFTGMARRELAAKQAAGIITAVSAGDRERQFFGRLDEADVRTLITNDPRSAIRALSDPKQFPNMDEVQRTRLLDTANSRFEADRSEAVRLSEKAERDAEKRDGVRADEIAKDGFTLLAEDALTARWLDINRPILKKADFRALQSALTTSGGARDEAEAVIDLTSRLDSEDVSDIAARYLRDNRLSIGTYQSVVQRNRAALSDDRPASPYKSARERVKVSLDPGAILSGAAAQIGRIGQSSALAELDAFAEANPEASRLEYNNEAEAIVDRFQILNFDQMSLAVGLPRFFGGRRDELTIADVDDAERKAVQAFDESRLTETGLELELRKLRNWRGILSAKPKPKSPNGRPNPARPQ